MPRFAFARLGDTALAIRAALARVEVLALFPLIALGAFWWGGRDVVFATSFLLPGLLAAQAMGRAPSGPRMARRGDGLTGLPDRAGLEITLSETIALAQAEGRVALCLALEIDEFDALEARWGKAATRRMIQRTADRLRAGLRADDTLARIGHARFAVALHPISESRLGIVREMSKRLQSAVAETMEQDGRAVHLTLSIGYCLAEEDLLPAPLLDAACTALEDALRNGPAALRSATGVGMTLVNLPAGLTVEINEALASGAIRPWFQPQVSTDTGAITGFEALARWHHPRRGVLVPADFLDAVGEAGRLVRLGEVMLFHALSALNDWEKAGVPIPSVSVNFSAEELRDPTLADRVKWEVDRFDLRPAQLTIEILETVAAQSADDTILHNIRALGAHGFNLDLDDFGTGQASIANIRRFQVSRIKIDRSFVTRLDQDPDQRAVVSGILALAERLGLATVAEGVETAAEHTLLAQLGCTHIQGYGLARPMPFDETLTWISDHNAKLAQTPGIGRRAG